MKEFVVFIIFVLAVVASFGQVCQPKQSVNKKYYLMTISPTNWYKAFQHCRYLGMHLVSISSQEENDRIVKQIQDEGHDDKDFWTSGTKLGNGQTYNWMSDGKLVQYSNWAPGQPDNHLWDDKYESCINIIYKKAGRDGLKWNDATCESNFYFICEQEQVEYEYCSS